MEQEPLAKVPGMIYIKANRSYSGSHQGMRWRVFIEEDRFHAVVWPQPWNEAHTDEALKTRADFPLDEQGLHAAEQWIGEQYTAQLPRWKQAELTPTF